MAALYLLSGKPANEDVHSLRAAHTRRGLRPINKKALKGNAQASLHFLLMLFYLHGFIFRAKKPHNVLSSRAVTHQVLSALEDFTAVFGMGTGVTPLLSLRSKLTI